LATLIGLSQSTIVELPRKKVIDGTIFWMEEFELFPVVSEYLDHGILVKDFVFFYHTSDCNTSIAEVLDIISY
jgi:hypothetical protein